MHTTLNIIYVFLFTIPQLSNPKYPNSSILYQNVKGGILPETGIHVCVILIDQE